MIFPKTNKKSSVVSAGLRLLDQEFFLFIFYFILLDRGPKNILESPKPSKERENKTKNKQTKNAVFKI